MPWHIGNLGVCLSKRKKKDIAFPRKRRRPASCFLSLLLPLVQPWHRSSLRFSAMLDLDWLHWGLRTSTVKVTVHLLGKCTVHNYLHKSLNQCIILAKIGEPGAGYQDGFWLRSYRPGDGLIPFSYSFVSENAYWQGKSIIENCCI